MLLSKLPKSTRNFVILARTDSAKWCPRQELNLRTWFRKPTLYPLSYEGARAAAGGMVEMRGLEPLASAMRMRRSTS